MEQRVHLRTGVSWDRVAIGILASTSGVYGIYAYSGSVSVTLPDVVLTLIVTLYAIRVVLRRRLRISLTVNRLFGYCLLGLIAILLGQALSIAVNVGGYVERWTLVRGSLLFGVFLMGRGLLVASCAILVHATAARDAANARVAVVALVGMLAAGVLWGVIQVHVLGVPHAPLDVGGKVFFRISGFQPEPSMFAPVLVAGILLSLAMTLDRRVPRKVWVWGAVSALLIGGFVLSYSTLGVAAGIIGGGLFLAGIVSAGHLSRLAVVAFLAAGILAVGLVATALAAPDLFEQLTVYAISPLKRLIDPADYSVRYRVVLIPAALSVFADNWAFGVGTGRLGTVLQDYAQQRLQAEYALSMNSYLNLIAESGLIAAIGVGLVLGGACGLYVRSIRTSRRTGSVLPIALSAGAFAGLASWAGLDNFLHFYTWLLLAIAMNRRDWSAKSSTP